MEEDGSGPSRINRRRFLGVAAGAATLAGLASAGCGGKSRPGQSATGEPESTTTPGKPTSTRGPGPQHGETLRFTDYIVSDHEYDPHKTQAGAFYGLQALVFSRLLAYENQSDAIIAPDLAEKLPEQPDPQTIVFSLNPNARWHERPPLNGRAVTAEDVKYSIERQLSGDASFVRKAQWVNIDKIEVGSPTQITFRLKAPRAAMLDRFADVNAFIVAPEMTENSWQFSPESQVGSGPFRWVEWSEGRFASVARNPAWHGGKGRPYLNGIAVKQPRNTTEVEAGFRIKELDVAFVGRVEAERLKTSVKALVESTIGQSLFFGMRFFIPQFPYNDVRFRAAVSIALDRRAMIGEFFAGEGEVNPWISWPITRWTLPQSELAGLPGYRPGADGRAEDIKEAKALLAAFKSEKKLPEDLALFVPDDAEQVVHIGSLMRKQLREALDLPVTVYPMPIRELGKRLLEGQAPWAAGPDNGWVDLDEWVFPYFHSEGTKNSFPLRDSDMDSLIDAQRVELDDKKRQQLGFEIQRKLLSLNVAANFVSERVVSLAWPYVRNFPLDAAPGYQHRFADCWIDQSDPAFRGR